MFDAFDEKAGTGRDTLSPHKIRRDTFFEIDGFTVRYDDVPLAPPPPGGDPPMGDNNVLELVITTGRPPQPTRDYTSEITLRAVPYSDVNATAAGDSGSGLAPVGISDPPDTCAS